MHDPSNNNCPINADPRNECCACDPPWGEEKSIVLTPNYEGIFRNMLGEALNQSKALTLFDCLPDDLQAQALRAVQRFFAPLNIACQCMVNKQAVEEFREAMNKIVQDIDHTAFDKEAYSCEED